MKKVPCGYDGCSNRRIHWEEPETMRPHRMIEVEDNFDESCKCFCSFECACYAGYMTLNNNSGKKYIEVDGSWWTKDPSNGKDKRFAKLNEINIRA